MAIENSQAEKIDYWNQKSGCELSNNSKKGVPITLALKG
jgi:hypothetical protein